MHNFKADPTTARSVEKSQGGNGRMSKMGSRRFDEVLPMDSAMYQRILVPYDGSATSVLALEEAIKLANLTGANLRVVYVTPEQLGATGFESYGICNSDLLTCMRAVGAGILESAQEQAAAAGTKIETLMLECLGQHLVDRIVEQAKTWNAELIVIGSHGRRGTPRLFMGRDAEQVLRLSPVPVLLVRPPDVPIKT